MMRLYFHGTGRSHAKMIINNKFSSSCQMKSCIVICSILIFLNINPYTTTAFLLRKSLMKQYYNHSTPIFNNNNIKLPVATTQSEHDETTGNLLIMPYDRDTQFFPKVTSTFAQINNNAMSISENNEHYRKLESSSIETEPPNSDFPPDSEDELANELLDIEQPPVAVIEEDPTEQDEMKPNEKEPDVILPPNVTEPDPVEEIEKSETISTDNNNDIVDTTTNNIDVDNTTTKMSLKNDESEESFPWIIIFTIIVIVIIIGYVFFRSKSTSEHKENSKPYKNQLEYQGILNDDENNDDDEEWGWDDNPKTSKIEIPTIDSSSIRSNSSLKLNPLEDTSIPSPSEIRLHSNITHRSTSPQQLSRRTITSSVEGIQSIKSNHNDDDVFAQMGLSSKPTFGSAKVSTSRVGVVTSGKSSSSIVKKSSITENKHNNLSIPYNTSDDDLGSNWDDDADLDDLLND